MPEGKIPQQNLEAEASLLGALLLDKENIVKIADLLRSIDFYKESHGLIYQAILDIYEKHEPVDILSIANRLTEKKQLAACGGKAYLAELTAAVPNSSHVVSYADIIKKKSTLRKLEKAAAESHVVTLEICLVEKILEDQMKTEICQTYR